MEQVIQVEQTRSRSRRGILLVMLGAGLWGIDPLFRLLVLEHLTATQIVLMEHLLLLLYALPVLWIHRKELQGCTWSHLFALLFISWGGSVVATILFTEALAYGNLNGVLLLQKLQPIFAVILARLLLQEKLPARFGSLLLLAVAGTYLLTFGWELPLQPMREVVGVGSLLALGAALLWGGSTVMGRLLLAKMEYETVTALRFLLALPLLFVLTWHEDPNWIMPVSHLNSTVLLYIVMRALLLGLISLLFYYRGLATTKASYATLAELSFPIVGMLVNWIVLQQSVTLAQMLGFLLIWLALYVAAKQQ